ncbi:hypothetical protein JX265_005909 [Neoarthrinium moseri]|uniref:Uncharacterized protein n=1 Tax=Neoarthrinium moseri TaxID=1658444 RepID=A0A9P9WNN6_9PEZI|nr:uncharacterized protein JN550_002157 [Neoarthrinium moseri]KAI1871923.1 hypothetical protein JX265_005909 [Neoarthrinium moseri]KAI1875871.1 hypothetical protein JN550_002157 [Neoarthrinium moseri]
MAELVVEAGSLPPPYVEAIAVKGSASLVERAGRAFPDTFYISPYSPDSSTKWVLSEYKHQILYAISRREHPQGNKPDVIIHDGLSLKDATFASFRFIDGSPKMWKVRLPPRSAEPEAGFELVSAGNDWRAQKRPVFKFAIETDVSGRREHFEWRSSNNDNIRRALGGGQSLGWKLVRLAQDAFTDELAGPRGAWPKTTDGAEIVAVFSGDEHGPHGDWRFAFLGTGRSRILGWTWEVMAVTSALIIMDSGLKVGGETS